MSRPNQTPVDHGAAVNEWTSIVKRARMPRTTTKSVALLMATYGNADGAAIYPGVARIAVQLDISYRQVQRELAFLRQVQLLEMTKRQTGRRGWRACYRLIIGPDTADLLTVLSPDEEDKAIDDVAEQERVRYRRHYAKRQPAGVRKASGTGTAKRQPAGVWVANQTPKPGRGPNATTKSLTCENERSTLPRPTLTTTLPIKPAAVRAVTRAREGRTENRNDEEK